MLAQRLCHDTHGGRLRRRARGCGPRFCACRSGAGTGACSGDGSPGARPGNRKVSLSADALFDFDKSVIKPEGKTHLDDLVGKLKNVNIDSVIDTGHTDRFGTDTYNMKLSQRRADAVKAYLVSQGVAANRISTEAKGETQHVTRPEDCKGPKSAKVIACLQPDRRVVIEVVGTRAP